MPGDEETEGMENSEEESEEEEELDTSSDDEGELDADDDESSEEDLSGGTGGGGDEAPAPQYFTVDQATKMFTQMHEHNQRSLQQLMQSLRQPMNPQQQPRRNDEPKDGLHFPNPEEMKSWGAGEWMNHMRQIHEHHDKKYQTLEQKLNYQTQNMTQSQKASEIRNQMERDTQSAIDGLDTFIDSGTGKPDEDMMNILRITVAQAMRKDGLNVNIRGIAEAIHNKIHGKVDRRYKKKISGKVGTKKGKKKGPPLKGSGSKSEEDVPKTLDEAKKGFAAAIRAQQQEG